MHDTPPLRGVPKSSGGSALMPGGCLKAQGGSHLKAQGGSHLKAQGSVIFILIFLVFTIVIIGISMWGRDAGEAQPKKGFGNSGTHVGLSRVWIAAGRRHHPRPCQHVGHLHRRPRLAPRRRNAAREDVTAAIGSLGYGRRSGTVI
jgi:hypothetical protein